MRPHRTEMKQSELAPMLLVPEPHEILAWFAATPRRLWVYFAATERRPLWLIVAVAALLCFAQQDLIPLGRPEAGHLASAIACEAGDAAGTQASWYSRLISRPLQQDRDPRRVATFVAALCVLALIFLYEVIGRYCSWRVAVLCCSLLGAAPWLALFTRQIEPPGLVLVLCSFALAGLLAGLSGKRPWGWSLAWMSALLVAVLSPDGFPVLCVFMLISVLWHRRVRWPYALLGLLVGTLLTLSAQFEDPTNTVWAQAALFLSAHDLTQRALVAAPLVSLARLLGGAGLDSFVVGTATPLSVWITTLSTWSGWVALLCTPIAALLGLTAWARWREGADALRYAIPVIWVTVTLALYLMRGGPVSVEQLASLLPVGMLAVALSVDDALARQARAGRSTEWVLVGLVTVFLVVGGYRTLSLYGQVDVGNASETYGTPLKRWRLITTLATRTASEPTDPLWVVTSGSSDRQDEQISVLDYFLGGRVRPLYLRADRQPAILLPAERSVRYLLLGDTPLQADTLIAWQGEPAGLVSSQGTADGAQLYRVPAWPVDRVLDSIQLRDWVAWEAGMRLVGYDRPTFALYDQAMVFATYWTFEGVPQEEKESGHRLSVTLFDSEGVRTTVESAFGLEDDMWKPGLLLKQWHLVPISFVPPSEPITILISIDGGGGGYRNLVIDDLGRPTDDRYVLGPFELAE